VAQTGPKELVVISGKGGTGKTSVVASLAALAGRSVLADCDVDAADLHLLLDPQVRKTTDFSGGKRASIRPEDCIACGKCAELCRFEAIRRDGPENDAGEVTYRVDPVACEGCGLCAYFCPVEAIDFGPVVNGQWFVSDTRCGPMVHARLGVAEENSGKLVSLVRKQAKEIAEREGLDLILIDGSPGIGCPVIASITGADFAMIVTEPSLSAIHDLDRVADLTEHFGIETIVCINKCDINEDLTGEIVARAEKRGLQVAGQFRYDPAVTQSQIERKSVVEFQNDGVAEEIRGAWKVVRDRLLAPTTETKTP